MFAGELIPNKLYKSLGFYNQFQRDKNLQINIRDGSGKGWEVRRRGFRMVETVDL